jgi:2-keto-4-pentenoate hydratase/2-oxohepta-3-ene-1,7-dioic acid hydratase in catechol pathway
MAVHVIHYEHEGRARWGTVHAGIVTEIVGAFATTADFLRANPVASLRVARGPRLEVGTLRWLSPVTRNQAIVCQGANYRSHMLESGMDPDAKGFNMIFRKASSAIVPADSDVVRPPHVKLLDYEIELGLVLGRDITGSVQVTHDSLGEFVAGVTIVNDYSARDVQLPETQFYKGKSYRTFAPVGPYLCLFEPGETRYLDALELTLKVNGEVRQRASTSEMVFGPAATLTELSGVQDLMTGDLIATGTPSGCALRVPPPWVQRIGGLLSDRQRWRTFIAGQTKRSGYLKPGDVVEAGIRSADGAIDLGVQRNRVVAG